MQQSKVERLWQDVAWKKLEYSRGQAKAAGNAIAKSDFSRLSKEDALAVVNNWRAAHAYPLQVFYMACKRTAAKHSDAIVAQRLKRLDSIVGKLRREQGMSVVRMQDFGGCRMIVNNTADVYDAIAALKQSRMRHELVREYDYIEAPKKSGYRCVHLVYKYRSDKNTDYNGLMIEVQIRTKLQHLWATAVEVLSLYTKSDMKSSRGDAGMLRYMELISALFSIAEGTPLGENVPQTQGGILAELKSLEGASALTVLRTMRHAIKIKDDLTLSKDGLFLLEKSIETGELSIHFYDKWAIDLALSQYEVLEADTSIDVVLVSVANIDMLKRAYPNYFSDVSEFIAIAAVLIDPSTLENHSDVIA